MTQQKNLALDQEKKIIPYAAIIVASLGYFVDVYDLLLFSVIRVPSLRSMGLSTEEITGQGIFLLNIQMAGLMVGGILWGVIGDKQGRMTVLFGSILLYSVANIANGMVSTVNGYALWRFIAGLGLAGELGAGVTLVAELMPRKYRGYATCLIAVVGISGAVVAYLAADIFEWRTSFFIGGGLGMILLFMRLRVSESELFHRSNNRGNTIGNIFSLLGRRHSMSKYLRCIAIGLPLWFVVGVLISLSPEFGKALQTRGTVNAGAAVAFCYGGSFFGGILSGLLSQWLKSRKQVLYLFMLLSALTVIIFFNIGGGSLFRFYAICLTLGITSGYWALFITVVTEQFGTNVRATVSTTVPNFVRGAVVPMLLMMNFLMGFTGHSLVISAVIVGILCFVFAFYAMGRIEESFYKDLDYLEEH